MFIHHQQGVYDLTAQTTLPSSRRVRCCPPGPAVTNAATSLWCQRYCWPVRRPWQSAPASMSGWVFQELYACRGFRSITKWSSLGDDARFPNP